MLRGLLASDDYRPQFSGHETFPLRQLWLRKGYDAVSGNAAGAPRSVFGDPDAISRFGVGKNMVSAIRHWALACDVLKETRQGELKVGRLGNALFGEGQLDPYLENPASAWLLHWHLAGEGRRSTTWYWLFNHVAGPVFERDEVLRGLRAYCEEKNRARVTVGTLSRDVDVCLRSYAPRAGSSGVEELIEPVLGELGLISHLRGSEYTFRIGAKQSLPDGILLFALTRFWSKFASVARTLSLESIAYERGALGPVFKLDLDSLASRLICIEESSRGAFAWSETAGLKQVIRRHDDIDEFDFLPAAYRTLQSRQR